MPNKRKSPTEITMFICNTINEAIRRHPRYKKDMDVDLEWLHYFYFMVDAQTTYTTGYKLLPIDYIYYPNDQCLIIGELVNFERNRALPYRKHFEFLAYRKGNGKIFSTIAATDSAYPVVLDTVEKLIDVFGINKLGTIRNAVLNEAELVKILKPTSGPVIVSTTHMCEAMSRYMSTRPDPSTRINKVENNIIYLKP